MKLSLFLVAIVKLNIDIEIMALAYKADLVFVWQSVAITLIKLGAEKFI